MTSNDYKKATEQFIGIRMGALELMARQAYFTHHMNLLSLRRTLSNLDTKTKEWLKKHTSPA